MQMPVPDARLIGAKPQIWSPRCARSCRPTR